MCLSLVIYACDGNAQLKIGLEEYASGFTKPVDISHSYDSRLFITEQRGVIKIIDSGNVFTTPFLDIQSRVKSSGNEQGLLGLAFHPDYNNNGYFFVNYTGTGDSTHVSRFSLSAADINVADPNSEIKILSIAQPYSNHNGGELKFGPDGYLYIGMGDGGSGGDPQDRAQDSTTLLGKMLRIDIDNGLPYTIPPSNPFVGVPGILEEIWAIGLRNPWRFSFDKTTGDLWIGDVGQNQWEEIDFQASSSAGGENYGWRCFEGLSPYNSTGCLGASNYDDPIHNYANTGFSGDCSVTGGHVYRGSLYPNLTGYYFYADYCSDKIWTLHDSSGLWVNDFHGVFGNNSWSTFGEDVFGEVFVAGLTSGKIFRIIDSSQATGVETHLSTFQSEVYPNPFSGEISMNIELENNENEPVITSVSEVTGAKVLEMVLSPGLNKIDMSYLKSGIYIVSMYALGETRHYKIVKN